MAVFSKPLVIHNSCYDIGHTWTPYCSQAAWDVAVSCYVQAFKIYSSLYLVAALVRRKDFGYWKKRLLHEILQSTLFLGSNGFLFISFFCVWSKLVGFYFFYNALVCGIPACAIGLLIERKDRRLIGKLYFLSIGFWSSFWASLVSILLERKSRRGLLAAYMSNVALETLFRMMTSRGLVRPIKHGEVYLFSIISAVYLYLFRKPEGLSQSTITFLRYIVGPSELPITSALHKERETTPTYPLPVRSKVSVFIQQALRRMKELPQHRLCKHNNSCLNYVIQGFLGSFSTGYLIQTGVKIVTSLSRAFQRPSILLEAVTHKDNFALGAFLGSFSSIFRAMNCLLRWVRDKDDEIHGLISGFLAGFSMMWYKSVTLTLYVGSKLAETLYFKGIESSIVPYIRCADVIIYCISTAFIFHVAVFEPHNLRPAYWKFLLRLTDKKFATMNRRLLDVFGTQASKLMPDHWPDYDMRFTSVTRPDPVELLS